MDPEGCLNRANPRKCAGQGTIVIASGRRGRGFKSRHPDAKAAGQGLVLKVRELVLDLLSD